MKEGEPGLVFFIILDGRVDIRRHGKTISTLGPNQFFGELSVIDDQPRSADVVALEPCRCLATTTWDFHPILSSNPSVAKRIMFEMSERYRAASRFDLQ